ncbi:hypothetical protein GCK72_007719 [Caenorhabditis remanei]|uniref:Uncharacterized protein n=1 Tax=Caenorhabditis remanei TaxID=31234 RepID=A0A6A5HI03_CAERE|nr:hypothetical protein GCK72_007719 [Caenorhabditis remanei]KAF1767760.1 hypothetical protein GCK72_007719 [Caenorhabditis remanei]
MFEDVDRYGFRIPVGAQPGDIDFGGGDVPDRTEADLNRAIERFKINEQTPDKSLVFESAKFQYRRKRLKPPYKFVICLSVGHNDELLEYSKPLRFAQKYLISRIFEKREASNHPVEIQYLHLCARKCIRFPVGLKLKAKNLTVSKCLNNLDEQIRPVLTDCSFPLVSIGTFGRIEDRHHPMIDSALEVKMNPTEMNQETVATFTHNRMHFNGNLNQLKDNILMIVENWQRTNRIVGTHFSFVTYKAEDVMGSLRLSRRTVELPELK